jgi:hypothetical protein
MKRFLDSPISAARRFSICWRWRRRCRTSRSRGARGQDPGPGVLQSVAAHAGLVPGRHGAARRQSFVITPGQGTWQLETRLNAIMNGNAAEHIREGIPVLASYCDALGVRAFAEGKNLSAILSTKPCSA